jgi:cytochrome P450
LTTIAFCLCVYNVYFHPLRRFPGPLLARATRWYFIYYKITGVLPFKTKSLHDRYGPVVRIAPCELSYNTSAAWQDICATSRRANFDKAPEFFGPPSGQGRVPSLFSANGADHRRMRRLQSHAFSERALAAQEPMLAKYAELLISRLHEQSQNPHARGVVDMVLWFNYTTFDLIGDLALGRPFGCLASGELHGWIAMIFAGLRAANILRSLRYFPPQVISALTWFVPSKTRRQRGRGFRLARELARERISEGVTRADGREDFMASILRANGEKGMSQAEMEEAANLYILAGSETTATLLSGLIYHLLCNPSAYETLVGEIRSSFAVDADVTLARVSGLPYLNAVLEEALRMYPPVPSTMPRRVPPPGELVLGEIIPGGTTVGVSHWAASRSGANFALPDRFVPERWLGDKRFDTDDKKAMQPFSLGPRNCIGKNLAYGEMRLILAMLLWAFDLELMEESRGWAERQKVHILWAKYPLMVRLRPVVHCE